MEAARPAAQGSEDLARALAEIVGTAHVQAIHDVPDDLTHDEALTAHPVVPDAVVHPATTAEVSAILRLAHEHDVPVVARGSGTGLSGGAIPVPGGIVVAFDRMARILDIDARDHVAVVQPGVTLAQLDEALAPLGLLYPVSPGELSASLGGNVATNAGGMRAVRYGVTRQHVLGLEAVLADGRVLRTGGRYVKSSTGYDLTQLLVGSEGTLALITEVTVKLSVRPPVTATMLAPFPALDVLADAVPAIIDSGVSPVILEYLDRLTMQSVTAAAGVDLGVAPDAADRADAYLLVLLDGYDEQRVAQDVEALGTLLTGLGALDLYVLAGRQGPELVAARERAFYVAKAAGADDLVDAVLPRGAIVDYLATAAELARRHQALVIGCGHVGDGNVHLSVFQPDPGTRHALIHALLAEAVAAGGAISGEHGIGTEKRSSFEELADPLHIELLRRVKDAFDPSGILAPGNILS